MVHRVSFSLFEAFVLSFLVRLLISALVLFSFSLGTHSSWLFDSDSFIWDSSNLPLMWEEAW